MKPFVCLLLLVGSVMVYNHWLLGVLVLVAGAFAVPMVVREIHDKRATTHAREALPDQG